MGGLGVSVPCCTQAQLLDPNFAYSEDGTQSWDMSNPGIMCDPICAGSGTGAAGATKSLIPGVSNGLLVGVCVALLIWLEFK